jgi:hypothetical protein
VTSRAPPPEDALRIFRERFLNRTDVVSILAPWGKPCPIMPNGTLDDLLLGHLFGNGVPATSVTYRNRRGTGVVRGRFRVGSYCPGLDDATRWLCIDFDGPGHADPLADPQGAALAALEAFRSAELPAYLECSGSGMGWHLWCFFDPPLLAVKARELGYALAPRNAAIADRPGLIADPRLARGIEVFPKQDKLRGGGKKGLGTPVWLPWWSGAPEGGNAFYRRRDGGELERYIPPELAVVAPEAIERVLASVPARRAVNGSLREHRPPKQTRQDPGPEDTAWAAWRRRALVELPLEAIYGEWLTGSAAGAGWLECRDPDSPSGDQRPSASVADGTGEAERGTFHSFISGTTLSVFDFLIAHGGAADFREARQRVAELSGAAPPAPPREAASKPQSPGPRRQQIRVNNRQLRDVIGDAWNAAHASNRRPRLFTRSGLLVRLVHGIDGPRIEPMNEPETYGYLARIADWVKVTEAAVLDVSPPKDVARDMMAYPHPELPQLDAVVSTPVFDRDGMLVATPGYHRAGRLWYEPPSMWRVPLVPARPSVDDVAAARSLLLDELLGDFPFVDSSCRAHMLAALLLPFARRLILGATPIHLFEAPTEGSGKGLLANVVALVATGRRVAGSSIPNDEDEIRKKLGSELATGRPLLVLDNADNKRPLDSSALASATTMWPTWSDRLLGQIKMFTVPNEAVWLLTGNNPRLSRELARRCVSIRIDPRTDRPWLRTQFRHSDLLAWVLAERARLVHAVLVLIQNWIAQGKRRGTTSLGAFERWAETIGGILAAADIEGFLGNLEKLYATADAEGTMWRDFVAAWWQAHRERPVRVSELVELCAAGEFMAPILGDGTERSQSTRLGKALQNARDRVFGDHRLEFAGRDSASKRPTYRLTHSSQQDLFARRDARSP